MGGRGVIYILISYVFVIMVYSKYFSRNIPRLLFLAPFLYHKITFEKIRLGGGSFKGRRLQKFTYTKGIDEIKMNCAL